jgi:molecular chaperone IbpA
MFTSKYTLNTFKPFSVGFDNFYKTFEHFDQFFEEGFNTKFPPHDIVAVTDEKFRIDVALAGYSKEQISIELDSNVLTIKSAKKEKDTSEKASYKGITTKSFSKTFTLADDVSVNSATMENGMLSIHLTKATKPATKTIAII